MWMLPLYLHVNQKSDYDDMKSPKQSPTALSESYFLLGALHGRSKSANCCHIRRNYLYTKKKIF